MFFFMLFLLFILHPLYFFICVVVLPPPAALRSKTVGSLGLNTSTAILRVYYPLPLAHTHTPYYVFTSLLPEIVCVDLFRRGALGSRFTTLSGVTMGGFVMRRKFHLRERNTELRGIEVDDCTMKESHFN